MKYVQECTEITPEMYKKLKSKKRVKKLLETSGDSRLGKLLFNMSMGWNTKSLK